MIEKSICNLLISINIIIFLLYFTNIIKSFTCNKDILSTFYSNFVHIEPMHLLSNIFTLYSLTRIEKKIGSKKFFYLIISCLILNTILESSLHYFDNNLKCSIGISGLLISVIVYDTFTYEKINIYLILSLFSLIFFTPLKYDCVSIHGHIVGFISGILYFLLQKI